MRRPLYNRLLVIGILGLGQILAPCLFGVDLTNRASSPQAGPKFTDPPLPPPPVNPVGFFRELLAKTSAERSEVLSNRPPTVQKLILAKVREYQSLRPDQRELRLQATELRWYLLPLLQVPVTNRAVLLEQVPTEKRKLIEDRLERWDKLPSEAQKQLLANEATIRYLAEPLELGAKPSDSISSEKRRKLEEGVKQWQQLSEDQRQQITARFNDFFVMTPEEQEKALRTLSDAERQQIDNTLRKYSHLSPSQRIASIRSFGKFASLRIEDRNPFPHNTDPSQRLNPPD